MTEKQITVIIPVYNSEKTLNRCIESLKAQTYSDFNIIFINNGSQDKSLEICTKFAKVDSRVKIVDVNKNNVSLARNIGIKQATTRYITFLDSDDYYEKDTIEQIVHATNEKPCDLLIYDYQTKNENRHKKRKFTRNSRIINIDKNQALHSILLEKKYGGVVWNKVFNTEKAKTIDFDDQLMIGEDLHFLINYFKKAESVYYIDQRLYNHVINNEGVTGKPIDNQNQLKKWDSEVQMLTIFLAEYTNTEHEVYIRRRLCRVCMDLIAKTGQKQSKKYRQLLRQSIFSILFSTKIPIRFKIKCILYL